MVWIECELVATTYLWCLPFITRHIADSKLTDKMLASLTPFLARPGIECLVISRELMIIMLDSVRLFNTQETR